MKTKLLKTMSLFLALVAACVFTGCSQTGTADSNTVQFTMEDGKTFTVEVYPDQAPETCANFLKLVDEGFYNGLTFHRVIDDFVAQGGDPNGNGTGGSDETIPGEFSSNGFTQNTLTHERGSVAMARSSDPDSASSQFYICYTDLPQLDGQYAVFGKVTEGMETVDGFLEIERNSSGYPSTPIVIKEAKRI
ncbi:MAG TPA: peptidylprolyl isomerase [Firmicutes bacterium]|nr:peptidylprolyl isomerase [Bacillota bacterium]